MVDDSTDRGRGILTPADRKFLERGGDDLAKNTKRQKLYRIRDRIQTGVLDFAFIVKHLPQDEREKIFDSDLSEQHDFRRGIASAIAFCYLSCRARDEPFRPLLQSGVNIAWRALGEEGRASVDYEERRERNLEQIIDKAEEEGLSALSDGERESFANLADRAEALNFEALREKRGAEREGAQWRIKHFEGKKRRRIPGGKWTPFIDLEVFKELGIGEMSGEQLRELFGEGVPQSTMNVIYDGEEVRTLEYPGADYDEE